MSEHSDDEVVEIEPDFSLKEKIGNEMNIKEIFTKDVVESSQNVINKTAEEFLEWVKNDISTLDEACSALDEDPGDEGNLKKVRGIAFGMKAQAGTFGYDLGSAIAKSLYDFCDNEYKPEKASVLIVGKHAEALRAIFQQNISGDGGKVGLDLLNALSQLIKKYA